MSKQTQAFVVKITTRDAMWASVLRQRLRDTIFNGLPVDWQHHKNVMLKVTVSPVKRTKGSDHAD